jgi:hypothetical protein
MNLNVGARNIQVSSKIDFSYLKRLRTFPGIQGRSTRIESEFPAK